MSEEQCIEVTIILDESSQFVGTGVGNMVDGHVEDACITIGILDSGIHLKGPTPVLRSFAEFILSAIESIPPDDQARASLQERMAERECRCELDGNHDLNRCTGFVDMGDGSDCLMCGHKPECHTPKTGEDGT